MKKKSKKITELPELVEYLEDKFVKIDDRFESIDDRFESIDGRFESIDGRLDNIEIKLDAKADKSDVSDLATAVDVYAHKADGYFQEMVMLSHQVNRHEKWLHLVADKLGLKLEY